MEKEKTEQTEGRRRKQRERNTRSNNNNNNSADSSNSNQSSGTSYVKDNNNATGEEEEVKSKEVDPTVIYKTFEANSIKHPMDAMYDMETNDPDDYLTFLMLLCHPQVNLRCVTLFPGSKHQVGLIRSSLSYFAPDRQVLIGAYNPDHEKECISGFHSQFFEAHKIPKYTPSNPDGSGSDILHKTVLQYPEATLITGAPLTNVYELFKNYPETKLARWVAQGGFAGDNIIPPEHRLKKFNGKITCPTFNFGGNRGGAEYLLSLSDESIRERLLVSKNVCHGVVYDKNFSEYASQVVAKRTETKQVEVLEMVNTFMTKRRSAKGAKAMHDPLAACVAIEPSIGTKWAHVEMYTERGGWGAKPAQKEDGKNIWIIVSADQKKFAETYCMMS